jgi:hypothetical protein
MKNLRIAVAGLILGGVSLVASGGALSLAKAPTPKYTASDELSRSERIKPIKQPPAAGAAVLTPIPTATPVTRNVAQPPPTPTKTPTPIRR